jgi:hypothetical protein
MNWSTSDTRQVTVVKNMVISHKKDRHTGLLLHVQQMNIFVVICDIDIKLLIFSSLLLKVFP